MNKTIISLGILGMVTIPMTAQETYQDRHLVYKFKPSRHWFVSQIVVSVIWRSGYTAGCKKQNILSGV